MPGLTQKGMRCRARIEHLAGAHLDLTELRRAAIDVLHSAVDFTRWCWPLTDPDSALSMSGIGEVDFWPTLPTMSAVVQYGDVINKPRLVTGTDPCITIDQATGGDFERSLRWRECLKPYGIGDQLMTACRDRYGCWGTVELMRDIGEPPFAADDIALLRALSPLLGGLLRSSAVRAWNSDCPEALRKQPGTIILDPNLQATSWTPAFHEWLAELPSADIYRQAKMLPTAIYGIAARLRAQPGELPPLPNSVRTQTVTGRWAVIEGAVLEGSSMGSIVIMIRSAASDEVFDLLCAVHGLTQRERELVALVLQGFDTKQIARSLHISPFTVKDHLKAVFEKNGVHSRRELTSRLRAGAPELRARA